MLYAPTWEGDRPSIRYSSVRSHGRAIVESLRADPGVRILYRPHPWIGRVSADHAQADRALRAALEADGDRHLIDTGPYGWQWGFADRCVTDVSAVAYDWLATRKPLIVTRPAVDVYLPPSRLLAALPLLDASQAGEAARLLLDVPAEPGMAELAEHYFGDTSRGAGTARFENALEDAIAARSAQIVCTRLGRSSRRLIRSRLNRKRGSDPETGSDRKRVRSRRTRRHGRSRPTDSTTIARMAASAPAASPPCTAAATSPWSRSASAFAVDGISACSVRPSSTAITTVPSPASIGFPADLSNVVWKSMSCWRYAHAFAAREVDGHPDHRGRQGAALLGGRPFGGQPGRERFDGRAQLAQALQVHHPIGAGESPAQDARIVRRPVVGGQHRDPDPLADLDQSQRLQHPDRLAHHCARHAEFLRGLIAGDPAAGRAAARDDVGAPLLDECIVQRPRCVLKADHATIVRAKGRDIAVLPRIASYFSHWLVIIIQIL